jgi:hypothetical protein
VPGVGVGIGGIVAGESHGRDFHSDFIIRPQTHVEIMVAFAEEQAARGMDISGPDFISIP